MFEIECLFVFFIHQTEKYPQYFRPIINYYFFNVAWASLPGLPGKSGPSKASHVSSHLNWYRHTFLLMQGLIHLYIYRKNINKMYTVPLLYTVNIYILSLKTNMYANFVWFCYYKIICCKFGCIFRCECTSWCKCTPRRTPLERKLQYSASAVAYSYLHTDIGESRCSFSKCTFRCRRMIGLNDAVYLKKSEKVLAKMHQM